MAMNQDVDQLTKSNLVVRIDQNSESDLQALFDTVLKPDSARLPLTVPLRMRKLPDSFFTPPSTGSKSPSISHSRENSADSAFGTAAATPSNAGGGGSAPNAGTNGSGGGGGGAGGGAGGNTVADAGGAGAGGGGAGGGGGASGGGGGGANSAAGAVAAAAAAAAAAAGLTVAHPRAHSSPASLQQTYASAQQAPQHAPQPHARHHHHHQKQRSYDVISTVDDLGPLPQGWEQARTPEGQIYFLNFLFSIFRRIPSASSPRRQGRDETRRACPRGAITDNDDDDDDDDDTKTFA